MLSMSYLADTNHLFSHLYHVPFNPYWHSDCATVIPVAVSTSWQDFEARPIYRPQMEHTLRVTGASTAFACPSNVSRSCNSLHAYRNVILISTDGLKSLSSIPQTPLCVCNSTAGFPSLHNPIAHVLVDHNGSNITRSKLSRQQDQIQQTPPQNKQPHLRFGRFSVRALRLGAVPTS